MGICSLLFVPGERPDQMTKALLTGADALILDLEDSESPQCKGQARFDLAAFLALDARRVPPCVRVNPLQSGLTDQNLAAVANGRPDGLVLPQAEVRGPSSSWPGVRIRRECRPRTLPIATETAAAVFHMGEYSTVAERL